MIKPKALQPGETIGVISPASPVKLEYLKRGIAWLENQGFQVEVGRNCLEDQGFLAGEDGQRVEDIHEMFANPKIKGIFCSRGGYGTLALLRSIDYDLIKRNPKVFLGYSDITALHLAIGQRTGLVTFHGPMVAELSEEAPGYNTKMLLQSIMDPTPLGEIPSPPGEEKVNLLYAGRARGEVTGGNLSVICSTLGTPFEIDCRDKILMIEDVAEPSYKIHRLLTQLSLAGKLEQAAGFIIGEFYQCVEEEGYPLENIIQDILLPYKKSTFTGVKCGHGKFKATLPLGCMALIHDDKLFIQEGGVL